jgi:hypothetical protein
VFTVEGMPCPLVEGTHAHDGITITCKTTSFETPCVGFPYIAANTPVPVEYHREIINGLDRLCTPESSFPFH